MAIIGRKRRGFVDLPVLLKRGFERDPEGIAVASRDGIHTWRELDEASDRLARHLLDAGLEPGDRVASLMPNRVALLVHYLACIKARLVATPLNYRYTPREIDHALRVSGASALFSHAERDEDLRASELAGRLPLGVITYGACDTDQRPSYEGFLRTDPSDRSLPTPDPDAPAFVFFTSGSTGKPKGVTHTFATFGYFLAGLAEGLALDADDVVLPASSCSHVGGLMCSLAGLSVGARVLVAQTFDASELSLLSRRFDPTVLWMLPAALYDVVTDLEPEGSAFETLRLCFCGGDRVNEELAERFERLVGLPIREGWGMTECGVGTINPLDGPVRRDSIGRIGVGCDISIRNESGAEAPLGEPGRVWVRTAGAMVGYWDNPEATAATLRDGWLDTGDVMSVDADGYFRFHGRQKQIIVHDGSNICPQEVEGALLEYPAVQAAGVVGVADRIHGEDVVAYVTLRSGSEDPAPERLVAFARERVGYKAPETVSVLAEMPLNATGKVDRVALKRMAESRPAAQSSVLHAVLAC